jgi:hypothetical protein
VGSVTKAATTLCGAMPWVWQRERAATSVGAFIPLSFAPGKAYQFDWSREVVLINGTTVTVKVAHVRLCHSRMRQARSSMRCTTCPLSSHCPCDTCCQFTACKWLCNKGHRAVGGLPGLKGFVGITRHINEL